MAKAGLEADKVCPLLNAALAAAGMVTKGVRTEANQCRDDCQWYIGRECAVKYIHYGLTSIDQTLRKIKDTIPIG